MSFLKLTMFVLIGFGPAELIAQDTLVKLNAQLTETVQISSNQANIWSDGAGRTTTVRVGSKDLVTLLYKNLGMNTPNGAYLALNGSVGENGKTFIWAVDPKDAGSTNVTSMLQLTSSTNFTLSGSSPVMFEMNFTSTGIETLTLNDGGGESFSITGVAKRTYVLHKGRERFGFSFSGAGEGTHQGRICTLSAALAGSGSYYSPWDGSYLPGVSWLSGATQYGGY